MAANGRGMGIFAIAAATIFFAGRLIRQGSLDQPEQQFWPSEDAVVDSSAGNTTGLSDGNVTQSIITIGRAETAAAALAVTPPPLAFAGLPALPFSALLLLLLLALVFLGFPAFLARKHLAALFTGAQDAVFGMERRLPPLLRRTARALWRILGSVDFLLGLARQSAAADYAAWLDEHPDLKYVVLPLAAAFLWSLLLLFVFGNAPLYQQDDDRDKHIVIRKLRQQEADREAHLLRMDALGKQALAKQRQTLLEEHRQRTRDLNEDHARDTEELGRQQGLIIGLLREKHGLEIADLNRQRDEDLIKRKADRSVTANVVRRLENQVAKLERTKKKMFIQAEGLEMSNSTRQLELNESKQVRRTEADAYKRCKATFKSENAELREEVQVKMRDLAERERKIKAKELELRDTASMMDIQRYKETSARKAAAKTAVRIIFRLSLKVEQSKNSSLVAQNAALQEKRRLETRVEELERSVHDRTHEGNELRTTVKELNAALTDEKTKMEKELGKKLQKQVTELETAYEELEEKLKVSNTTIDTLKKSLKDEQAKTLQKQAPEPQANAAGPASNKRLKDGKAEIVKKQVEEPEASVKGEQVKNPQKRSQASSEAGAAEDEFEAIKANLKNARGEREKLTKAINRMHFDFSGKANKIESMLKKHEIQYTPFVFSFVDASVETKLAELEAAMSTEHAVVLQYFDEANRTMEQLADSSATAEDDGHQAKMAMKGMREELDKAKEKAKIQTAEPEMSAEKRNRLVQVRTKVGSLVADWQKADADVVNAAKANNSSSTMTKLTAEQTKTQSLQKVGAEHRSIRGKPLPGRLTDLSDEAILVLAIMESLCSLEKSVRCAEERERGEAQRKLAGTEGEVKKRGGEIRKRDEQIVKLKADLAVAMAGGSPLVGCFRR